jgi:4-carboxymuconolactone decarboxylase
MNEKITAILAVILVSMFNFTAIAEGQNMDANQALSAKQQSIVPIAAFTANGDLQKLKTALNEGLDAGLTINEIKEVLAQLYAYAGFPRSLNSIDTFIGVLEEREQKGIKDELGEEPTPCPPTRAASNSEQKFRLD